MQEEISINDGAENSYFLGVSDNCDTSQSHSA